jgi:hypothetical protein
MKKYLSTEISKFTHEDLSPMPKLKNAVEKFLALVVSAALIVTIFPWYGHSTGKKYFDIAIEEGVGAHLPNVVGIFAFVFLGLFIIFNGSKLIAIVTNFSFDFVFTAGALMIGIVLGRCVYTIESSNMQPLDWFHVCYIALLLIAVTYILFITWYLGFLADPDRLHTGFAAKLSQLDRHFRLISGLLIIAIPVTLLLLKN